jgi:hypothetical protein
VRRQQGRASQRRRWAVLAGWLGWGLGLAWLIGDWAWLIGDWAWLIGDWVWLGWATRGGLLSPQWKQRSLLLWMLPPKMDLPPPFVLPNLQQRRRRALRATAGTVLRRRCWRAGQAAVPTSPFTSGRGRPCTC